MQALEQVLRKFSAHVKRQFAVEIARDSRAFKKQVLRLMRRELPPGRGRPNDPHLDAATRLVEQGRTVSDVLRSQIPGFDEMDTYSRYLAEKGLRSALARRRRR